MMVPIRTICVNNANSADNGLLQLTDAAIRILQVAVSARRYSAAYLQIRTDIATVDRNDTARESGRRRSE